MVDVVEGNDSLFVVMEYVEGENPLHIMKRSQSPIAEGDVIDWGVQLCDVLSYLHARGIIHRNVQPGNVLIQEGGRVKLFGYSVGHEFNNQLEYDGMPLGVSGYAPPRGNQAGYAVDAEELP